MTNFKTFCLAASLVAGLSSCNKAVINGSFSTTPPASGFIVVKTVDGKQMKVLDTVRVSADGCFRYRANVRKGQPDFFYLYNGDVKLASLLLSSGDKLSICCDTLGSWTVAGSDECVMLRDNERELSAILAAGQMTGSEYVAYYRKMTAFVMRNTHSLVAVPALYTKLWDTPLFGHPTDAVLFSNVADSLQTIYPDSKYVKALRTDADKRMAELNVRRLVSNAPAADFPELNLPDINGGKQSLTAVHKGKTLLVFWDCSDSAAKMFNIETLKPYYEKKASAVFNIYQVNVNPDKNGWAVVMREQKLPWVNVCDIYGKSAALYGVDTLPAFIMIENGKLNKITKLDI